MRLVKFAVCGVGFLVVETDFGCHPVKGTHPR